MDVMAPEMNECRGTDLATQIWLHDTKPNSIKLKPISCIHDSPWAKPRHGGLWTAQWDEVYGGGWVQWCITEEFEVPEGRTWPHVWLLEPEANARVLVIDSYEDLERICARWPHRYEKHDDKYEFTITYPAWHSIAIHYDAVHLTEKGQWSTRLSEPLNLYGWDCESTLWFRWVFAETRYLGSRTFEVMTDE